MNYIWENDAWKKNPFLISNTDRSDKGGTHWWRIMNISPKGDLFLFDSYGIEGLKHFIVIDDKKIVSRIIKGIKTMDQKDKRNNVLQAKVFNDCIWKVKRKKQTFRKCLGPF